MTAAAWLALVALPAGSVLLQALLHALARRPATSDPCEPRPVAGRAWTFAGECAATCLAPLALCWPAPRATGAREVLVLVHGRTAPAFWLARRLRRAGWGAQHAVRYARAFDTLDAAAARLGRAVHALADAGARRVHVVAHGAGGIVVRAWLAEAHAPCALASVVTLGAPHAGPEAIGPLPLDAMGADLRAASPWRRLLGDGAPAGVGMVVVRATGDVVVPPASGWCRGAVTISIDGPGHWGLLLSSRVATLVAENLETDGAAEAAAVS
jgi:hypothetical protein